MSEHIHRPGDPRIFVFGSNLEGAHAGGAAAYAARHCGAQWGIGQGLTGNAYALPTCNRPGVPLVLWGLRTAVRQFVEFAIEHPELHFFVSEVGCGIAGFKAEDVAPLFVGAPPNCDLPLGWRELAEAESKRIGRMYGADRDYSGDPPTGE